LAAGFVRARREAPPRRPQTQSEEAEDDDDDDDDDDGDDEEKGWYARTAAEGAAKKGLFSLLVDNIYVTAVLSYLFVVNDFRISLRYENPTPHVPSTAWW
jgi:hypothetical protein